jgi:hypothetical protein
LATTCALEPAELAALPDLELDVVHVGAERDLAERQRVAGPGVGAGAGDDGVTLAQPLGVQDVPLLAVGVDHQRDPGRPVGIILDLGDLARDPELVPLEVDLPVLALVPAAPVPGRQVAEVVPPAGLLQRLEQRLLRGVAGDLVEPGHRAEAGAGRHRPELPDAHLSPRTRRSSRRP